MLNLTLKVQACEELTDGHITILAIIEQDKEEQKLQNAMTTNPMEAVTQQLIKVLPLPLQQQQKKYSAAISLYVTKQQFDYMGRPTIGDTLKVTGSTIKKQF
jgi:hypothetical protein